MKRINLLPQEERVKASRERGLIWAILILVAIVIVLGLGVRQVPQRRELEAERADQHPGRDRRSSRPRSPS